MFTIPRKKKVDTDLPIIVDNFRPLLVDASPVLFSGTNRFGNRILGSSVDEDYSRGIERYFHAIVETVDYSSFLKGRVTYLHLLRKARPLFVLDRIIEDNRYDVYEVSLGEIPAEYTPSEDTYCPQNISSPSFQYSASLNGGLADTHRALPKVISQTQNSIADAITYAFTTIRALFKVEEEVFLEASYAQGSFEIKYEVQLQNIPSLFQQQDAYYLYLNDFLEYCFDNLPSEADKLASLKFDELSGFNNLVQRIRGLSLGDELNVSDSALREGLVRDLAGSAQALYAASKDVGRSYKSIDIRNGPSGQERSLGIITPAYRKEVQVANTLFEASGLLLAPTSEESAAREYTIHLIQFHKMTGNGIAYLRDPVDERKLDTVRITVDPYEPISPNPYTHSLDQNVFIRVKGTRSGNALRITEHLPD